MESLGCSEKKDVPQHSNILTSNLSYGQEATVRIECGETEWCPTGKGVRQGACYLPVCLICTQNIA